MIVSEALEDGLQVISFNRPDKRNALTPEMLAALDRSIEPDIGECSGLVIAGNGPVFCGGFDLRLCLDEPGTLRHLLIALSDQIRQLRDLEYPVVIAAHGAAIAGGCALLGGADYVVTNDDAKLGYPVVRIGVSPAVSAPFLRKLVGDGRARRSLLDTELISGRDAARMGLVSESVAKAEDVLPRALEVVRSLIAKPGFVVTKGWLNELESDPSMAGAIVCPMTMMQQAEDALSASLSIEGQPEERERLAALFAKGEKR